MVKALNTLQYAGDRAFKSEERRDTLRDSGDLVARARGLYLEQRWDSRTHKQAVSVVCETLDLKRRRVNAWAAKFDWERMCELWKCTAIGNLDYPLNQGCGTIAVALNRI